MDDGSGGLRARFRRLAAGAAMLMLPYEFVAIETRMTA